MTETIRGTLIVAISAAVFLGFLSAINGADFSETLAAAGVGAIGGAVLTLIVFAAINIIRSSSIPPNALRFLKSTSWGIMGAIIGAGLLQDFPGWQLVGVVVGAGLGCIAWFVFDAVRDSLRM